MKLLLLLLLLLLLSMMLRSNSSRTKELRSSFHHNSLFAPVFKIDYYTLFVLLKNVL